MCGICGFTTNKGSGPDTTSVLQSMLETLDHRGPDESGFFVDDRIALGHKRLSIIDLSSGKQPLQSETGNYIVFNGEIYNYKEIKKELESRGRNFLTNTDTEVALVAYEEYGPKCLDKYIGMFSLAIYDLKKQILFIARDRIGKKPFYFYQSQNFFAFGSEIKALLKHPAIQSTIELDFQSLSDYLSIGYILTPKTIFKTIRKLPAAHYGLLDLKTYRLETREYWQLEAFYGSTKLPYNAQTIEDFRILFEDSVRLRLRSDVPLGTFLSGGIDSSSVVACIKKISDAIIKAFTVSFKEDSFDETAYADLVARHIGVEHALIKEEMENVGDIARIVWLTDEPFCDTSIIPTYLLSRAARRHVKVILSGDGADELLAGYPTIRADQYFSTYSKAPVWMKKALLGIASSVLRPSYKKVSFDYKLLQFLKGYPFDSRKAHYFWRTIFSDAEKSRMLGSHLPPDYDPYEIFEHYYGKVGQANFLDMSLYVDIKTWLQDDILVKVDRMSMGHALEVRSPFLDHRLLEFCAILPQQAKISSNVQKVILKDAMRGSLPERIIHRAKKGFNFPTYKKGFCSLNPPRWGDIFHADFELDPCKEDATFKGFSLFILKIWFQMYENFKKTKRWEPVPYGER